MGSRSRHAARIATEWLLGLVGRIYDSVEAPERWAEIVRDLTEHLGATKALLFTPYHAFDDGGLWHVHEISAEALASYGAYYHTRDLWIRRALERGVPMNVPVSCDALVPAAELDHSEWYNDFLGKLDIRRSLSLMMGEESPSFPRVHLSIYRPIGSDEFEPEAERALQVLAPHLRRALDLGFRFAEIRDGTRHRLEALNRFDLGVVALDGNGAVLFLNRRAEEILQARDGLSLLRGRIAASDRRDEQALGAEIRRTACRASSIKADAGGTLAVHRPSGRRSYVVNVSPGAGLPSSFGVADSAVLLLVADPERRPELPVDRIARLHGLTPSEARLAAALVAGQTLEEYAERTGITRGTARWTIKKVLAKTDCRRQSELMLLLAGSAAGFLAGGSSAAAVLPDEGKSGV